jgi:hypothetical protein
VDVGPVGGELAADRSGFLDRGQAFSGPSQVAMALRLVNKGRGEVGTVGVGPVGGWRAGGRSRAHRQRSSGRGTPVGPPGLAFEDRLENHCFWLFRSLVTCVLAGVHSAEAFVPPKQ